MDKISYEGKDCNGYFWLTGSQKFLMMKGLSESLAGRVAIFKLSSLSKQELENRNKGLFNPDIEYLKQVNFIYKNTSEIYEMIFKGDMPKVIATNIDREKYYSDYINTYLERDIKDLSQVGKLNEFYDFLVYIAARTGQELKYDKISKQIGVSAPTKNHG